MMVVMIIMTMMLMMTTRKIDGKEKDRLVGWLLATNLRLMMMCYYCTIAFSSFLGLRKQSGLEMEAFCNIYMLDI